MLEPTPAPAGTVDIPLTRAEAKVVIRDTFPRLKFELSRPTPARPTIFVFLPSQRKQKISFQGRSYFEAISGMNRYFAIEKRLQQFEHERERRYLLRVRRFFSELWLTFRALLSLSKEKR